MTQKIALHTPPAVSRKALRGTAPQRTRGDDSTFSAESRSRWQRILQFAWAGAGRRRLSAKALRAVAERGVYGALAALLNEGPVAFSWDHRGRPAKPTGAGIGAVLAPSTSRVPGPTLGEILAPYVASRAPALLTEIPQGTGQALRDAFKRGGWAAVQYALVRRPWLRSRRPLGNARSEMLWRIAIDEAFVFAQAHFDFGRCEHGHHWYVRKDVRQEDCPRHKRAGQQARWRKWARRHRDRRAERE